MIGLVKRIYICIKFCHRNCFSVMRINTKIRYGLRTLIVIASTPGTEGILQKDIAESQCISVKYLDSIVSSLKLKGLIVNVRGKGSGYRLARPADEITMLDIYTAFERIEIVECLNNENCCPLKCNTCKANEYWFRLKNDFLTVLNGTKLSEIIK